VICSSSVIEKVWLGRDNTIEWAVFQDDTYVSSLSYVTRVVVDVGEVEVDSDVAGSGTIWWTDSVTGKTLANGVSITGDVVKTRLGRVTGIDPGEYEEVKLILFDVDNPLGVVVSDTVALNFVSGS
jgi:hypothetical protein